MNEDVRVGVSKFLRLAVAEARRQQIVPRFGRTSQWERVDGPWPPYCACQEIAGGALGEPLVKTLRAAYPERFGAESKFPYKDPTRYVCALLRAVIANRVIRRSGLVSRSSGNPSCVEELDRVVSIDGQRFASLWVISDVDFRSVDHESIRAITLFGPRQERESLVSSLMPEALWVGDHGYPMPGERHQGLLWAQDTGQGHHWDVTRPLNNSIGRFMTTLRLATATTSRERVVWIGEPSWIHVEMPEAHPQASGWMESRWRRVATLTPEHLAGLRDLTAMMDRLDDVGPKKTLPAVVIAMRRYSRSFRGTSWQDSVLDLATALEACLAPPKDEIGLTLRTRAAHLLAHDDSEQAEAIYNDIDDLYTLRSDIIHGNAKLRKDLPTLWAERGYAHVLEEDRLHTLLERWREIVRRAISARLMLGDNRLGEPMWPLAGKEIKVDRFLVRRDARDAWRERIVAGASAYRLPLLADPAPPLIDYLRGPDA
jgi:hypothetical protein